MPDCEHEQRASNPAPRRYGAEDSPFRGPPKNTDTPEASAARLAGELPPPEGQLPSPQSSAAGGLFRAERLRKAKRLLRHGLSLEAVANIAGVSKAELDLALWNSLGETRA
jgi:hypothetical protein